MGYGNGLPEALIEYGADIHAKTKVSKVYDDSHISNIQDHYLH